MNVGIIYRYFPLSKYGFIKMLNESVFFHSSNLQDDIKRLNYVAFDIIDTPKGKAAVNIKLLQKCDDIIKELYYSKNPLYKWLAVENDSKLYELEKKIFDSDIDKKFKMLCEKQDKYLNLYVNQFSSLEFLNNYKIVIDSKFGSIGGKDWTDAWFNYFISSKYEINYKFDIDFISNQLNFETNKGRIEPKFEDNYITEFLYYYEYLYRKSHPNGGNFDIERIDVKDEELDEIRLEKLKQFREKYDRDEHLKSLSRYQHKNLKTTPLSNCRFRFFINDNIDQFLFNNTDDYDIKWVSKKELAEGVENDLSQFF